MSIATKFNVSTLRAMPREDVVNEVCINLISTAYTYLNAAKGIVALGDTEATRAELTAALTADGFKPERIKNLIKNAKPAVDAWASIVEPGHATEEWFDRCTRDDFMAANKAVSAVGAKALADEGYFKLSTGVAYGKFELVVERGMTQAQYEAKQADASPPAAASESGTQDATESKTTSEKTTTTKPAKSVRPATEVLEEKVAAAEKAALELLSVTDEVTAQKILTRLASIKVAADAVVAKRFSAKAPAEQLVGAA
jgi:hypothetical protein